MKAKLRNMFDDDVVEVHSTTNHPDSSYGEEVWVDDDRNCYGLCEFGPFGYEIFDIEE